MNALRKRSSDIVAGDRFGRLTTVEPTTWKGRGAWACLCDCGSSSVVVSSNLVIERTKSCGCLKTNHAVRHGHTVKGVWTPEYTSWHSILSRCTSPASRSYANYGARGIAICERWRTYENFLADMGPRPSPKHSLDRKDANGNYEPDNCRWATAKEQQRNRRNNRLLSGFGKTQCLAAWVEDLDVCPTSLARRIKRGESLEEAARHLLSLPSRRRPPPELDARERGLR